MSQLFIDVGNTAVKWLLNGRYDSALIQDFNTDLLPEDNQVFVSCVGDKSVLNGLKNIIMVESQASFKGFKSAYRTPQDLGVDRFLTLIAVADQFAKQNTLIIDAGSALTFDLLLANGEHQGGLIMPGLCVMRNSFDKFKTASRQIDLVALADNTINGWEFGTAQMLMSVINTQINHYLGQYGDLQIILTGGDAKMIAYRLNHLVMLKPNLVLEGLALYAQSHKA